jgi:hypothetical protein
MFVLTEFLVYLSQIVMFFFVAVLTSNLLRDEKNLLNYMTTRINENTVFEVVATMLAVAATMGIIAGIARAAPASSLLERLADEVLGEAPRTAYVFGSSVTGTLLAAALFMQNHLQVEGPRPQFWLFAAILAAFVGFAYGCMFAYAFKHKAQVSSGAVYKNAPRTNPMPNMSIDTDPPQHEAASPQVLRSGHLQR